VTKNYMATKRNFELSLGGNNDNVDNRGTTKYRI